MASKTCRLLNVNDEQIEAIQIFINMNEWDTITLVVDEEPTNNREEKQHQEETGGAESSASTSRAASTLHYDSTPPPGDAFASGRTKFDLLKDLTLPECDKCYLQPCVTHYEQSWLVKPKQPSGSNRTTRRRMYKKFWSVMDYRGAWQDPRYVSQKKLELQEVGYLNENTVWEAAVGTIQREIMPECVLSCVRGRYPNPPNVPYTGHHWN